MSAASDILGRPLELPCGVVIKNRFFKSAMSETLGTRVGAPRPGLARLYRTWAEGGTGLLVTGNIMVDPSALGEPGNVIVQDDRHLAELSEWAAAGATDGAHCWAQLNHPGKQSPRNLSSEPVAPSAIPLGPGMRRFFKPPRALEEPEIEDIIRRFAVTAGVVKAAGFTGVQIHGAHGYLVNQFLSPLHNQRTDGWGGSAARRTRFLLELYQAIRQEVGPEFPVGLKLNSADFQRGGFTEDESLDVVRAVAEAGLDLLEISGGNYESPVMAGRKVKESTRQREAYFLEYGERVREIVSIPLVVTGGFRTSAGMTAAVQSGATDMVGLARPLAVEPDLVARVLAGDDVVSKVRPLRVGITFIDSRAMLEVTWYAQQLARMAAGKAPKPDRGELTSLLVTLFTVGFRAFGQRRPKPRKALAAHTD